MDLPGVLLLGFVVPEDRAINFIGFVLPQTSGSRCRRTLLD
jgi:hypothetical protein